MLRVDAHVHDFAYLRLAGLDHRHQETDVVFAAAIDVAVKVLQHRLACLDRSQRLIAQALSVRIAGGRQEQGAAHRVARTDFHEV